MIRDLPQMPRRTPARQVETPERWMARLARNVVDGAVDAPTARQRLEAYIEAKTNGMDAARSGKTAAWMRHYVAALIGNMPRRDLPQLAASAVKEAEIALPPSALLANAPEWVRSSRGAGRAALYARLYCFAGLLGWGRDCFEMAQGMTAGLFGCSTGDVTEFIRKATCRARFIGMRKGHTTARYMVAGKMRERKSASIYRLSNPTELEGNPAFAACLERMQRHSGGCPAACGDRWTLAVDVAGGGAWIVSQGKSKP